MEDRRQGLTLLGRGQKRDRGKEQQPLFKIKYCAKDPGTSDSLVRCEQTARMRFGGGRDQHVKVVEERSFSFFLLPPSRQWRTRCCQNDVIPCTESLDWGTSEEIVGQMIGGDCVPGSTQYSSCFRPAARGRTVSTRDREMVGCNKVCGMGFVQLSCPSPLPNTSFSFIPPRSPDSESDSDSDPAVQSAMVHPPEPRGQGSPAPGREGPHAECNARAELHGRSRARN